MNQIKRLDNHGRIARSRERIHSNSKMLFHAAPISWTVGALETHRVKVGSRVVVAYIPSMTSFDLRHGIPVEFVNHQLLDLGVEDEDALIVFMEKWGLPFSPMRSADTPLFEFILDKVIQDHTLARQTKRGIRDSDLAYKHLPMPFDEKVPISQAEAKATLMLFQRVVRSIHTSVLNQEPLTPEVMAFVDLGCTSERILSNRNANPIFMRMLTWQTLSAAICNQIVSTIADTKAQWYECNQCDLVFKRRQGKSKHPDSDSCYCSDRCKERRMYERRKEN